MRTARRTTETRAARLSSLASTEGTGGHGATGGAAGVAGVGATVVTTEATETTSAGGESDASAGGLEAEALGAGGTLGSGEAEEDGSDEGADLNHFD